MPPEAAVAAAAPDAGAVNVTLAAGRWSSPRRSRPPERFRQPESDDGSFQSAHEEQQDDSPDAAFLLDHGAPVDADDIAAEDAEAAATYRHAF